LWLREGEKCTKFFHRVANSNTRNNSIDQLKVNGTSSSDQYEIGNHIVQFYDSLFTEAQLEASVGWPFFDSIGEDEAIWLERTFEEDEVFEVVKALNGEKALGPNGFTMAFFQTCWDVLKVDIMSYLFIYLFMSFTLEVCFKKVSMPPSSLLFQRNWELLILRTFDLLA
jgi:hypothetical protein